VPIVRQGLYWLVAIGRWLGDGWHIWAPILGVAGAFGVALRSGATEPQIRITGLVLQAFGLATVAVGIRDTRRLFGQPDWMRRARAWLSGFPHWRRPVIIGAGGATISLSGGRARMKVWTPMEPNTPVETRLKAVIQNVERMSEQLDRVEERVDSESEKLSTALQQEQQTRTTSDRDLAEQLEKAQTGDLHVAFVGVILLFVGLVLSTLAPEIARFRAP
jgi:hypothetical protein